MVNESKVQSPKSNVEKAEEVLIEEIEAPIKRKNSKRKKQEGGPEGSQELEHNLIVMIKTVFDMAALRNRIWTVDVKEVEAIAKPGARILVRLGAENEANKNADYFLLLVGIGSIVIPRMLLIKSIKKEEKKEEVRIGKERTVNRGAGENVGQPAGNVKNGISELLPSLI